MSTEALQLAFCRPRVIVYAVVSADGKTAHRLGASRKTMLELEDDIIRRYRHALRSMVDAIMVGSGTIRVDDPYLTVRHVSGRNPLRVIPNSQGDLPLASNVLTDGNATLVAVGEAASEARVGALRATGASVVTMGAQSVDLPLLLQHLYMQGVASLLVEGGSKLLSSLFRLRMVDRLLVQHIPVVFGGVNTPSIVGGEPLIDVEMGYPLDLMEVQAVGQHAVIIYERTMTAIH